MSEPASAHASLSATGYADGLGRRTLEFDRESGGMLERLHLRAEFGAFEAGLRQRIDRIAPFEDARFARVRAVERDSGGLSALLPSRFSRVTTALVSKPRVGLDENRAKTSSTERRW